MLQEEEEDDDEEDDVKQREGEGLEVEVVGCVTLCPLFFLS